MTVEQQADVPPTVLTVRSTEFERLSELDRRWWLRRCEPAAAVLARLFSPRRCDLAYAGPFRARLTITDPDGTVTDAGELTLEEPC